MSLPAAIAFFTSLWRSLVVAASKNSVSSLFLSAALRSVEKRSMPCASASASTFSGLRPSRIGSGMTRSPFLRATPPCLRIATIERMRCWFMPMRPVTPFMTMPRRCWAMLVESFVASGMLRHVGRVGKGAEGAVPTSRAWCSNPGGHASRRDALPTLPQPALDIGAHERVVVEVGISGADAVDLLHLARAQAFVRVEAPDAVEQALAAEDFVAAGDYAVEVVGGVEDRGVAVGDLRLQREEVGRNSFRR